MYNEEDKKLRELGISDEMIAILDNCPCHRSNSGLEFFQRETGMHYLFDEIPPFRGISYAPRYLSIALTTECNLSCPFCYVDKSKKLELNPAFVKGIVHEAEKCEALAVSFGGGEPTLYPYLEEVLKFTHEETKLAVGMTSNCTENLLRLTPAISQYVDFLRLSMDGINDTYYKHRGIPFENFVKRINYLLKFYKIGINYLVDETTIDDLDEAFVMMKDWGIRELLLLPREPDCPDSVIKRLHEWIEANKNKGILMEISSARRGDLSFLAPYRDDDDSLDYAHIDANGILKASSFMKEGIALYPYMTRSTYKNTVILETWDNVFAIFRSLFENGSMLPGIIEIEGKFPSADSLEQYIIEFENYRKLSKAYEKELFETGVSDVELPSYDPFPSVHEYFLAYNHDLSLERICDDTVRITTKSKMYPAFIYDMVRYYALVSVRYIAKEDCK